MLGKDLCEYGLGWWSMANDASANEARLSRGRRSHLPSTSAHAWLGLNHDHFRSLPAMSEEPTSVQYLPGV